tara:strand:+ start:235 stop:429 length:195 start_codon:yes stop_codon:yes gene_type:complete
MEENKMRWIADRNKFIRDTMYNLKYMIDEALKDYNRFYEDFVKLSKKYEKLKIEEGNDGTKNNK